MKALIIDDEHRAQRTLEALLESYCPQLNVVGKCSRVSEAVSSIQELKPDIVFLDIDMPGENGLSLFNYYPKPNFKTIFTTAYEKYAIDAFRVAALDYLLKPIQADQLVTAVQRASETEQSQVEQQLNALKDNTNQSHEIRKVSFPTSNGLRFVTPSDIVLLKSEGSYTHLWLNNGEHYLISRKLGEFEFIGMLPYLSRCHRSYVVNLKCVKEYIRSDGGYFVMENGETASISREKKEQVLHMLEQH